MALASSSGRPTLQMLGPRPAVSACSSTSSVTASGTCVASAITVTRTSVGLVTLDRKSTRLNSSHPSISYAVFCLKKKTTSRRAAEEALAQVIARRDALASLERERVGLAPAAQALLKAPAQFGDAVLGPLADFVRT